MSEKRKDIFILRRLTEGLPFNLLYIINILHIILVNYSTLYILIICILVIYNIIISKLFKIKTTYILMLKETVII